MAVVDVPSEVEREFEATMTELKLSEEIKKSARDFLSVLRQKSEQTYAHSLRVGLLARKIAQFMHLDQKALFFAGIFHDLGKSLTPLSTLHKTSGWTAEDSKIMESHVTDSHRLIRDKFDFSADIVLWHHQFQDNAYPVILPDPLHNYSRGTLVLISEYGRILAIADVYDALHRKNNKFEGGRGLTGEEIRDKMLEHNKDRELLIKELYDVGILDRGLIATDTPEPSFHRLAWQDTSKTIITPEETARMVMLAAALEPIPQKTGCTTRSTDISRHLKLEYFIAGAINIGQSFEGLAQRFRELNRKNHFSFNWPEEFFREEGQVYFTALQAQRESLKNRSGGRINQGIIELLIPIIAAQHVFYLEGIIDLDHLFKRAVRVLHSAGRKDVNFLVKMKKLAYSLSRYADREVPDYSGAETVYDYYQADFRSSVSPTSLAHNGEFVGGFPTVRLMYDSMMTSSQSSFAKKVEEAFREGLKNHDQNVGRGFIADCTAAAIYLCLSQNPQIQFIV